MAVATSQTVRSGTGESDSPSATYSNVMAFEANSQGTNDRPNFKDLSLHQPPELSQSSDINSIDVANEAIPNGVHLSTNDLNGVRGAEDTPPSSFVESEAIKHGDSSTLTDSLRPDDHSLSNPAKELDSTVEDPAVQHPTSDPREHATPISDEQAIQIKGLKHERDFAQDPELTNEIAEASNGSKEMTHESAPALTLGVEDMMDISTAPENATSIPEPDPLDSKDNSTAAKMDVSISNIELPHHPAVPVADGMLPEAPIDPATSPVPTESQLLPSQDQIMQDAPKSPGKVARSREEEGESEEGPATKRTRTDDDGSQVPEFKVPDLPQSAVERSSPSSIAATTRENGTSPVQTGDSSSSISAQAMTKSQHRFLLKGLQNIRRLKDSAAFNAPVDPLLLGIPTYPTIITKPMDLRTMEEKLKAGQYSSVDAYVADFDQVVQNSVTFNGPEHVVTLAAQSIRDSLRKQLTNLPGPDTDDSSPAPKKSKKASNPSAPKAAPARRESRTISGVSKSPVTASSPTTFALGPQGVPLIRRDSTANDGRPKREIHPPAPRDLPYANQKPKKKKYQLELRFCQEIVTELKKPKYSGVGWPFANPVDPVALNIPHYYKLIKNPMDLRTIETKLIGGEYENAKEFEADIRLMFANCYRFNPSTDDVHHMGKQYEAIFDEKWSEKKQWLDDHAPASGPQSPGSSPEPDNDEDEEEEEDDEAEDQLTILQKQIAAMSEQVKMIQKKKASPPASGRKASKGGKPVKKEAKRNSTAAPVKSEKKGSSKPVKTSKIPYVTYEQKQDISNRINSLPEAKMATALAIIRDNMPNLKGVQEDEIELDIDELSNDVLYKLLGFVRKYAPRPTDSPPRQAAPSAPAAPSRPKKNKPMSKNEQESKIQEIRSKLSGFQNPGSDESPEPDRKPADDTSGDEDDSEESEED